MVSGIASIKTEVLNHNDEGALAELGGAIGETLVAGLELPTNGVAKIVHLLLQRRREGITEVVGRIDREIAGDS